MYRVTRIHDLNEIIIPHFLNYPLLTNKSSDFLQWSKVIRKMLLKEHLNKAGFLHILSIYASINRGLSKKVLCYFPSIIPEIKKFSSLPSMLNPNWVSGFVAGDGGFVLGIRNKNIESKRFGLYWNFSITQHSKEYELIKLFISFFESGYASIRYSKKTPRCDFWIQDLNSIITKVIPDFETYPLYNIKQLDYLDFKLVMTMVYDKNHLKRENHTFIENIINRMNGRRI